MKYIGAISMILVGALIIGLATAIPGFSVINITQSTATVTYSQTNSYPVSTNPNSPTIFPSSSSATLTVTFSTNYVFVGIQSASVTGTVTIVDYTTSSTVVNSYSTTWAVSWNNQAGGSGNISTEPISPEPTSGTGLPTTYYKIVATSSYTFNNPIQGGQHVYQIVWNSKLTYNAKVAGSSSYTTGTIYATGTAVYGEFSPATVYPGYFMLYNCTSSWNTLGNPYGPLTYNTQQINIQISYTQPKAYLEFIYVEYNASGNSLAGFGYAYFTFASTGSAQWKFSSSNTTTYNGYPALYLRVVLPPGSYTIDGYTVYNYGQNGGLEHIFEMATSWNVTSTGTSSLNLNTEQIISYVIGAVLIFMGAIDAWK